MGKWNEEAAPNNNMTSADVKYALKDKKGNIEFSEELADGGERNERYEDENKKQ